ncbi:TetR/AcrR family transcriptional regulator [uncultured Methylobacterium sp.]|uniref:TetR/AcrR family transcriptional regulator n=1 Tax=uncultured Methylobacterium sp. TaxID=157278 RepID=UPI0035C9CD7A
MRQGDGEPRGSAGRDRLLATARRLFTRHGASNVGINDVTAAAGVARMTLYNNFPSKDALTAAVYEEMAAAALQALGAMATSGLSDDETILGVFDHFDRREREADYRGCPFIHASLQAADAAGPIYAIVQAYKRGLREHILHLLDAGRPNRAELADQIVLLLDGAVTEAYLGGVADPVTAAKRAAATLLRARP